MDYEKLANEFLEVRNKLASMPEANKLINPNYGERFVLGYLARANHPVNPKELSEKMNVSSARMAAIINQLESKELVKRSIDSNNKKYTIVELMPLGHQKQKENVKEFKESAIEFFKLLGDNDAAEYIRIQKKIINIFVDKNIVEHEMED